MPSIWKIKLRNWSIIQTTAWSFRWCGHSLVTNEHLAQSSMHMYRILPSKRPPPFFDDPMVHVYMRYTYKWLLRVNAHPRFWPQILSAHGRLIGRHVSPTCMYVRHLVATEHCVSMMADLGAVKGAGEVKRCATTSSIASSERWLDRRWADAHRLQRRQPEPKTGNCWCKLRNRESEETYYPRLQWALHVHLPVQGGGMEGEGNQFLLRKLQLTLEGLLHPWVLSYSCLIL